MLDKAHVLHPEEGRNTLIFMSWNKCTRVMSAAFPIYFSHFSRFNPLFANLLQFILWWTWISNQTLWQFQSLLRYFTQNQKNVNLMTMTSVHNFMAIYQIVVDFSLDQSEGSTDRHCRPSLGSVVDTMRIPMSCVNVINFVLQTINSDLLLKSFSSVRTTSHYFHPHRQ